MDHQPILYVGTDGTVQHLTALPTIEAYDLAQPCRENRVATMRFVNETSSCAWPQPSLTAPAPLTLQPGSA